MGDFSASKFLYIILLPQSIGLSCEASVPRCTSTYAENPVRAVSNVAHRSLPRHEAASLISYLSGQTSTGSIGDFALLVPGVEAEGRRLR